MSQPLNHSPYPFTEKSDKSMLLDSLPEPVLLSMINDRARALDLEWLTIMRSNGLFDTNPAASLPEKELAMTRRQWCDRCNAMLGVMAAAELVNAPDPHDTLPYITLARFDLSAPTQQFINEFCIETGKQAHQWQKALSAYEIDVLMAKLMGLVAMMNKADLLETLAATFPKALTLDFKEEDVGDGMFSDARKDNAYLRIGPLFCALEFSSTDCVQFLVNLPDADLTLYTVDTEDDSRSLTAVHSFGDMAHFCTPQAMVPLLKREITLRKDDPHLSRQIRMTMESLMLRAQGFVHSKNPHLLGAFLDSGVADIDANASLRHAVSNGWPQMVAHFQDRIDWDLFAKAQKNNCSPVCHAIENKLTAAFQALMAIAQASGREQSFLAGVVLTDGQLTEDTAARLVKDQAGVSFLAPLLALGLDPDMAVGSTTLRQMAAHSDSDALSVMHSVAARCEALALIEDMELEGPSGAASFSMQPA